MTAMVVAVTGFGSVWRRRIGKDTTDPRRFARTAYYNTTGVPVNGAIRARTKVAGYARFNSGSGMDPNHPQRMIGRVFECDEPCVWQGQNKIFFQRLLAVPCRPEYFLVVARQSEIGRVAVGSMGWKSDDGLLVALSESRDAKEIMLLLPAHGWIHTDVGTFSLQPIHARPWTARLQMTLTSSLAG